MIPLFLPMLAVPAQPFDSPDHLFEVKWDGVRALASIQHGRRYVWGHELAEYTERYPELDVLCSLPAGTVVDGELIVLHDGRADFNAILRRHADETLSEILVMELMAEHPLLLRSPEQRLMLPDELADDQDGV